ncbi:hypothetical protein J8TS2_20070 [Lederbergia ruris]|uniref:Uncharacterized protein n=1 Tax=Lederbergia ruris TaxID=217495 RepID=A0ABQ4KK07_9BACI|nr:hypothetical protein J8TS2_20070 [Lederbergia ruris]
MQTKRQDVAIESAARTEAHRMWVRTALRQDGAPLAVHPYGLSLYVAKRALTLFFV